MKAAVQIQRERFPGAVKAAAGAELRATVEPAMKRALLAVRAALHQAAAAQAHADGIADELNRQGVAVDVPGPFGIRFSPASRLGKLDDPSSALAYWEQELVRHGIELN